MFELVANPAVLRARKETGNLGEMIGRAGIGMYAVFDRGFALPRIQIDPRADVLAKILLARERVAKVAGDAFHRDRVEFQR